MGSLNDDQFLEAFVAAQSRVYGYIATFLANRADVEDLFQQTSLVLWKKRSQYDSSRAFVPWAIGIAHNEVRNFIRRSDRKGVYLSEAVVERLAETRHATAGRIESRLQRLAECMDELTGEQRKLIEVCYVGRKPIRAIAEERRIEPAAFYKRLDRVRWALIDCMNADPGREDRP
ncbi:MAG: sigma-70 family RNA polymerase sigma factor [Pirellulales bacterium]|nr:sigma-70 family RNA polymerase sigma factor [Pirellulales bacterium]